MELRLPGLTATAMTGLVLAPGVAAAQTLDVTVTIPRINAAEYHKPYVAIWLEKDGVAPRTIAVWYDYDLNGAEGAGTKWLRDMRKWWRTVGRTMSFPADGVTGATRAPGTHKLSFVGGRTMPNLTPGDYRLVVEAAREVGGRQVVTTAFRWDGRTATSATGSKSESAAGGVDELGAVSVSIKR